LAVLLGCGLRRSELTRLTVSHLQQRDGHWAIVDLFGKGGHVRPFPSRAWVRWLLTRGLLSPVSTLESSSAVSAGPATFGVTASVRKRSGGLFVNTRNSRALIIWRLTTCAGLAHGCVIPRERNLNKSNFCSATGLWKLQNDTWVRGRDWCRQSTITSGSNRQAAHKLLFRHIRKC
jgi:integrase